MARDIRAQWVGGQMATRDGVFVKIKTVDDLEIEGTHVYATAEAKARQDLERRRKPEPEKPVLDPGPNCRCDLVDMADADPPTEGVMTTESAAALVPGKQVKRGKKRGRPRKSKPAG
jgi:hypothetical protein